MAKRKTSTDTASTTQAAPPAGEAAPRKRAGIRDAASAAPTQPPAAAPQAQPPTSRPADAAPARAASSPAAGKSNGDGGARAARPTHEQIAQRAYDIWVAKGRPSGQDAQNWQQAERELTNARA